MKRNPSYGNNWFKSDVIKYYLKITLQVCKVIFFLFFYKYFKKNILIYILKFNYIKLCLDKIKKLSH
jgi:hypothetical protein